MSPSQERLATEHEEMAALHPPRHQIQRTHHQKAARQIPHRAQVLPLRPGPARQKRKISAARAWAGKLIEKKTFEIAHLSTSDGIGVELFCFPHGVKEAPEFSPFNTGLFHFCIQDPDIESLVEKVVENGGKQRMPIREYYPNDKPYKMCYVEDPFGIVFEIYTHSYELTYSSGAYQNNKL